MRRRATDDQLIIFPLQPKDITVNAWAFNESDICFKVLYKINNPICVAHFKIKPTAGILFTKAGYNLWQYIISNSGACRHPEIGADFFALEKHFCFRRALQKRDSMRIP